jgi:hypothetical protein
VWGSFRRVFGTQQSGGNNDLYPSGLDVVDQARDEELPGKRWIALQRGDVDSRSLVGIGDSKVVEVCRRDTEVLGVIQMVMAASLRFDEREQIGVNRICLRGGHAVRETLVGLQRPVL